MSSTAGPSERRNRERWRLQGGAGATMGGHQVRLLTLSLDGADLEHRLPFTTGREALLEAELMGRRLRLSSRIVRCRLARTESGITIYHSAVSFDPSDLAGEGQVRAVLTDLISSDLEASRQHRNPATA